MSKIIILQLAEDDLIDIWHYTWQTWGQKQADSYLDALEKVMSLLAKQPKLSRERTEFNPPVRIHPHAQHLIIYQEIKDGIKLIRVLHKSMDIESHIGSET